MDPYTDHLASIVERINDTDTAMGVFNAIMTKFNWMGTVVTPTDIEVTAMQRFYSLQDEDSASPELDEAAYVDALRITDSILTSDDWLDLEDELAEFAYNRTTNMIVKHTYKEDN